jgi:hypothetical protein
MYQLWRTFGGLDDHLHDLRQIHFRDLGSDESMPCPSCESTLNSARRDLRGGRQATDISTLIVKA